MDRRRRVADRALRVPAVLLHAFDRLLEIARIIERVKDAEDVHAVLARERREAFDDVVRIMLVAEDVLSAEEHLQGRLLADLLDLAKPLPRILAQKAHADVERRAAPALKRVEARVVDRLGDLQNVIGAHPRRPKRLVRIAQRGIGNSDLHVFLHKAPPHLFTSRSYFLFLPKR